LLGQGFKGLIGDLRQISTDTLSNGDFEFWCLTVASCSANCVTFQHPSLCVLTDHDFASM